MSHFLNCEKEHLHKKYYEKTRDNKRVTISFFSNQKEKHKSDFNFCRTSDTSYVQISGGSRIFPRWRREPSGWGGGAGTHNFAKFSQKLHEIERILTPERGVRPKFYYVDPPMQI